MKDKTTANLTNFKPNGELGEMFEKAKMHNHFNFPVARLAASSI